MARRHEQYAQQDMPGARLRVAALGRFPWPALDCGQGTGGIFDTFRCWPAARLACEGLKSLQDARELSAQLLEGSGGGAAALADQTQQRCSVLTWGW